MQVLIAEPWYGGSHRAWLDGYRRSTALAISTVTLPPAGWKRRLRTGGSELAEASDRWYRQVGKLPDVILASSMMNVAQYRSGLPPALQRVPMALYMHENQLGYDPSRADREWGRVSIESAAAVDRLLFNSHFHLESFFAAWRGQDEAGARRAHPRTAVVPVGIEAGELAASEPRNDRLIVWNHRWEADKRPALLASALDELTGEDWTVALLGEGADTSPIARRIAAAHPERVTHAGWLPRRQYVELLQQAGLVVSTASQEFFGIAVAEAIAAGALPVVPDRLAYPELVHPDWRATLLYPGDDPTEALRSALTELSRVGRAQLVEWVQRFDWSQVAPALDRALVDSSL